VSNNNRKPPASEKSNAMATGTLPVCTKTCQRYQIFSCDSAFSLRKSLAFAREGSTNFFIMHASSPLQPHAVPTPNQRTLNVHLHRSDPKRPWLVLVNSPPFPVAAFQTIVHYFHEQFPIVTWDYHGQNSPASRGNMRAIPMGNHVEDLIHILHTFSIEQFHIVAWGLGAQTALEFLRTSTAQPQTISLISPLFSQRFLNALFERPQRPWNWLRAEIDAPLLSHVLSLLALSKTGSPATWAQRFHQANKNINAGFFQEVLHGLRSVDPQNIHAMFRGFINHSSAPLPESIEVPTLALHGDQDHLTPTVHTRRLIREIPHGESITIRGGSHYSLFEFPEFINLQLEKFLTTV
jgi:pimeloyl-ACP methyl ester carboxylesterase